MGIESEGDHGEQQEAWRAGENEFAKLGSDDSAPPDDKQPNAGHKEYLRTNRTLEMYRAAFGDDFGTREELILDLGAGDATAADEIAESTDHRARVIRLDRDYLDEPPEGNAPALAADATKLPFDDGRFDRIVSHNMLYYIGREQAEQAVSESLRVLKPGGEALFVPMMRLRKANTEIAREEGESHRRSTLIVSKPADYDTWDDLRKAEANHEIAKSLARGKILTQFIRKIAAKNNWLFGTHRTSQMGVKEVERNERKLEDFRKRQP